MYRIVFLCSLPAALGVIIRDPPPSPTDYKYSYDIEDPSTGDSKSQHEVRQGDVVSGAYSVVGPDGTKRIVEYTADSKHGFQAILREEPIQVQETTTMTPRPWLSKKPIYTLVEPFPYGKDNVYFTPGNEIESDRFAFDGKEFFLPATK